MLVTTLEAIQCWMKYEIGGKNDNQVDTGKRGAGKA